MSRSSSRRRSSRPRVPAAVVDGAPLVSVSAGPEVSFADLGVPAVLVSALAAAGRRVATPVQRDSVPAGLAGRDVLARAATGSGKTLAFLVPLVARLAGRRAASRRPLAVVLAPTRELASQIHAELRGFAPSVRAAVVFGGVPSAPQVRALSAGCEVVVACPGRLLDLLGQGALSLAAVETVVLDEADHMADQGFLPMVRRILVAAPGSAQQLWFSATLDGDVGALVAEFMSSPVRVSVDAPPAGRLRYVLVPVEDHGRVGAVALLAGSVSRCVVFCRTKARTRRLCRQLNDCGVAAVELHGNLSQPARERNLAGFSSGLSPVLVATDIAARGIHVDGVDLVVHADVPVEHKAFVHRSGRTGRAGADGVVVTLCPSDELASARKLLAKAGVASPEAAATAEAALSALSSAATVPSCGAAERATPPAAPLADVSCEGSWPAGLVWPAG